MSLKLLHIAGILRSILIYYAHPLRHRRLRRLYAMFVRKDDLVFDIGAHVGNHSRVFLSLGAEVVALEPQPRFFNFLNRMFRNRDRFRTLDCALGEMEGETELFVSSRTPTVSSISKQWIDEVRKAPSFSNVEWDRRIRVRVETLDGLIREYGEPAFVKIDVEGGEADVLAGLTFPLKALSFEVLPLAAQTGIACLEKLADLGAYQYNWSVGETAVLQPAWVSVLEMKQQLLKLDAADREINVFARKIYP